LCWNVKSGEMPRIFSEDGKKIDYFSDHIPLIETTKAYHEATSALNLDSSEEKRQEQKKCLINYHEALKMSKASPTYNIFTRMLNGTVKGEYGAYFVGPKNIFGLSDTLLSCVVTIGDHHSKKVGCRSNWDIRRFPISTLPDNWVIFVASDGVHDCYTVEELAKEVMTTESDQELLQKFVEKSKKVFQTRNLCRQIVQHDDISFFRTKK